MHANVSGERWSELTRFYKIFLKLGVATNNQTGKVNAHATYVQKFR